MPEDNLHPMPDAPEETSSATSEAAATPKDIPKVPEVADHSKEFDPNFSPSISFDLRTKKPEKGSEAILKDYDPNAPITENRSVSVPFHEFEQMSTFKDFELRGFLWSRSELTEEDALRLANEQTARALKATETSRKEEQKIQSEIVSTVIDHDNNGNKRPMNATLKWGIAGGVLILIVGIFTAGQMFSEREYLAKAAQMAVNKPGPRTFYPAIGAWRPSLIQVLEVAKTEIIWVTSKPADEDTWARLAKAKQTIPRVMVVASNMSNIDLAVLARRYGLTTFSCNVNIGSVNWLLVDGKMVLDGSGTNSAWLSMDVTDAKKTRSLVNTSFLKEGNIVYEAKASNK